MGSWYNAKIFLIKSWINWEFDENYQGLGYVLSFHTWDEVWHEIEENIIGEEEEMQGIF